MKIIPNLLLVIIVIISFYIPAAAQEQPAQQQAIILKRQVQRNHFSPRPVDDSLSSAIFSLFINYLDRTGDIFTAGVYQALSAWRYKIDNELNNDGWAFLDFTTTLYKNGLHRADSLIKEILKKPLDFSKDESVTFYTKPSRQFAKDENELKAKWMKWFKYIILSQAYSLAAADTTGAFFKDIVRKNEPVLREKIQKGQQKIFQSLLDPVTFSKEIKETYFNAIAASFDPHTNYFSPKQQEDFQSELSTSGYSFGFGLEENKEGKIIISQLIPGGPAWKTGEIHKNDELLQLQWKGKPPADVSSIGAEEAEEMLAASNHDELIIKIKKTNGTIRAITLRKEKIETEENVVKGYLLAGEKKIGYISLPDFYTTWGDENGSGCANDMAKEIIKMKKENLGGLVLDLRFNGGGSLFEALQLCGIFIDEGPLVGTKGKDGKESFDKDPNRGTIYDGPLVVLVNNQSASASEMVAAALQDYHRAVIVGSTTYGKATMQQVFPMDSSAAKASAPQSPNGFIKITTGKLYRLTGETAQCNGVIPDIVLPDAFDGLEYREKFEPYVLPADSGKKNSYYKFLAPLPVAALAAASKNRIEADPAFKTLIQNIQEKATERKSGKRIIPLQPEAFEKWIKEKEASNTEISEEEHTSDKLFTADNYSMEKERLQNNTYAADLNIAALKNIQTDIYIKEAYNIITDLIKLQQTK